VPAPLAPSAARRRVNRLLSGLVGYELRRSTPRIAAPPPRVIDLDRPRIETPPRAPDPVELRLRGERVRPGDRLLTAPVFVLSSVRSGSTLLRVILDSHPEICAPHELHLRRVHASATGSGRYAMDELGLDDKDLRFLLWDRLLHRELQRAGKTHYVNKTPNDALIWAEIVRCWPDARFIHLHRNPAAILASWSTARGGDLTRDELAHDILAYATGMEQARTLHGGLVVRYEDLTADPETQTRRICRFVGVDWAPAMIDYGTAPHLGVRRGLGDWSAKLRSGRIQPTTPLPDGGLPEPLRAIATAWGYPAGSSDRRA
jgi:hypothetical protein